MLVIRAEQLAILAASVRTRFECEMAAHLEEFFPERLAAMGHEQLRLFISRVVDKALSYDIEEMRDVCKFLDVAMALGESFYEDPELPWSREILDNQSLDGPAKVEALVKAAIAAVEQGSESDG